MASGSSTTVPRTAADTISNLALMGDVKRLSQKATRQNVNNRDSWGQTPLLRAAWAGESTTPHSGHADCASFLLSLGADPNVKDPDGVSALHWTAESENLAVLRLLAKAGARLDSRDKRGLTPLMLASWRGNVKAARELLQLGCDPDVKDKDGDTAASLAEMNEHGDIVRLLADWRSGCRYTTDIPASDDDAEEEKVMPVQPIRSNPRNFVRQQSAEGYRRPTMQRSRTNIQRSLPLGCYKVTNPQGHCVIINIEHYQCPKLSTRTGSELDVQRVANLFASLCFNVKVLRDLTAREIFHELSAFAKQNHSNYGAFVCFLMAHGIKGAIYGSDGHYQQLKELMSLFKPNKCEGLDNKPKLFFVQACRGSVEQVARPTLQDQQRMESPRLERDGEVPVGNVRSVPVESDFLICFANTEDSPAYRDPEDGSVFIQTLCDVIDEQHEDEYLEDMLLVVNRTITSRRIPGNKKGIFYHSVMDKHGLLNRRVSLNPRDAK